MFFPILNKRHRRLPPLHLPILFHMTSKVSITTAPAYPVSGCPGGGVPLKPGSSGLLADRAGSSQLSQLADGWTKLLRLQLKGAKKGLMTPSTKAE